MINAKNVLAPLCIVAAAFFVSACDDEEPTGENRVQEDPICGGTSGSQLIMINRLGWARILEDGVAAGLNIDDHVSLGSDAEGCNKSDFTGVDGSEGVDNEFARSLLPVLESLGGIAVEGLIQNAINEGDLLMGVLLENVDSLVDDDCVHATVLRASGVPTLGTNNLLEPGQTFDRSEIIEPVRVEGLAIEGGHLVVGPVDVQLPLFVFDVFIDITARNSLLEFYLNPDGSAEGVLSGGVDVEEIAAIAEGRNDIGALETAIPLAVRAAADVRDEDGRCSRISVGLEFGATNAFLFDTPPVDEGADETPAEP